MATTRKRTLGFSEEAELTEVSVSEIVEVSTIAETLPVVEITPEPEPTPEPVPAPVLLPAPTLPNPVQPVQLVKPVKRHPRNIPKFAAWKQTC